MSKLKAFNPDQNYGMFGYAGTCCDSAIRTDDAEAAKECWRRGYMDYGSRMLHGTVGDECERRAPRVAAVLKELGATQCDPMPNEEFLAPVTA